MHPDNRYVSYLDGLRGYAILLVIAGHFNILKICFARFGVTIFFFVSGFLITKLLIYEYNKYHHIDLKNFYLRRFFRLYPALIFMITTTCIVLFVAGFTVVLPDILSGLFYFTNYYLAYFKPNLPDSYLLVSNILWSLSVEEHFYLIFPLLFALFFPKREKFIYLLTALLIIFLTVRLTTAFRLPMKQYSVINYFTTHSRGDSILYGCVSALLIFQYNTKWYIKLLQSKTFFYVGIFILLFALIYRNDFFQGTFAYSLFGIGSFLAIPSFSFANTKGVIHSLVDNKITVYIGKLSYSLYLFHWVSLKIGNLIFGMKNMQWFLLVVPLTVLLSITSYYLIERPFQVLRKKYGSNVRLAAG